MYTTKFDWHNSDEIVVPDVGTSVGEGPLGDDVLARVGVAVHEDGVDVVGAVVALERRDVRPEVVGCRLGKEEKGLRGS